MWELRGCPYCRETHLVNFAEQEITSYIRANFEVLQLNLIGSRKVIDFDRQELAEKDLAQKYAIRFTPTFQFFPPIAGRTRCEGAGGARGGARAGISEACAFPGDVPLRARARRMSAARSATFSARRGGSASRCKSA